MKSLVIWDMDGTLFDSAGAVPMAFIQVLKRSTDRDYTTDEIVEHYSLGPPSAIFAHILERNDVAAEVEAYHTDLNRRLGAVRVYPGIEEVLKRLSLTTRQAVFTGASRGAARILLRGTGLEEYFEAVTTGDDVPPKPSPVGLIETCTRLGVLPANSAYVGDGALDIEAALRAGVMPIRAAWGHLASQTTAPDVVQAASPTDVESILT